MMAGRTPASTHPWVKPATPLRRSQPESGGRAPAAERDEELPLGLRRERHGRQPAGGSNRLAHLVDVGLAPLAPGEVVLEALAILGRQRALEVIGDQLDQLVAAHLDAPGACHGTSSSSWKYRSSAARTLERARWRSTLWLVSLNPRALRVSAADQPLMSRRAITSRWRGGSAAITSSSTRRASSVLNRS